MKLTPTQTAVVDKLRDGWQLYSYTGIHVGGCLLRKERKTEAVRWPTFEALRDRGILRKVRDLSPVTDGHSGSIYTVA